MFELTIQIDSDLDFTFGEIEMELTKCFETESIALEFCKHYITQAIDNLYTYGDLRRYNEVRKILEQISNAMLNHGYFIHYSNWLFSFCIERVE